MNKSFLVLFFKKELLPSLSRAPLACRVCQDKARDAGGTGSLHGVEVMLAERCHSWVMVMRRHPGYAVGELAL
jgi:hypothetical protein